MAFASPNPLFGYSRGRQKLLRFSNICFCTRLCYLSTVGVTVFGCVILNSRLVLGSLTSCCTFPLPLTPCLPSCHHPLLLEQSAAGAVLTLVGCNRSAPVRTRSEWVCAGSLVQRPLRALLVFLFQCVFHGVSKNKNCSPIDASISLSTSVAV